MRLPNRRRSDEAGIETRAEKLAASEFTDDEVADDATPLTWIVSAGLGLSLAYGGDNFKTSLDFEEAKCTESLTYGDDGTVEDVISAGDDAAIGVESSLLDGGDGAFALSDSGDSSNIGAIEV